MTLGQREKIHWQHMEFKHASVSVVNKTSMITRSRRDLINVYMYGLSSAALPYQFIMKTKTKVKLLTGAANTQNSDCAGHF